MGRRPFPPRQNPNGSYRHHLPLSSVLRSPSSRGALMLLLELKGVNIDRSVRSFTDQCFPLRAPLPPPSNQSAFLINCIQMSCPWRTPLRQATNTPHTNLHTHHHRRPFSHGICSPSLPGMRSRHPCTSFARLFQKLQMTLRTQSGTV